MRRICALLPLALLVACSGTDSGSARPDPAPSESEVQLAPHVDVGFGPVGLTTADDGSVWVVAARDETVSRIPPGAEAPDLTVDVPGVPLRATSAYGAIWVTSFHGKELLRIDPATGQVTASVRTGAGPEGVAPGFGSVWLVAQDAGKLLRIDPGSNQVSAEIPLEMGARLVAAGPDAMYVAHYANDAVLRVDPRTDEVTSCGEVCDGPQAMAVLDGRVWVTCTLSDELVALDAATLQPVGKVAVEGSPDSVATTPDGRLAVVAEQGPTLLIVDPGSAAVVSETVLGAERALGDRANVDLALAGGEAWVSSFNADRVYHVPLPG
jgi:streptogramin lyase